MIDRVHDRPAGHGRAEMHERSEIHERPATRRRQMRRDVRARFLAAGQPYGCAETVLLVLEHEFGVDDAADGAAAMALNGGVAYSGGTCGAITGAAIALGLLAGQRVGERARAKRLARALTASVVDDVLAVDGATDCRALTGVDLRAPGGHDAFIASGLWRRDCLRRLERVVDRLAPLAEHAAWEARVAELDPLDPPNR